MDQGKQALHKDICSAGRLSAKREEGGTRAQPPAARDLGTQTAHSLFVHGASSKSIVMQFAAMSKCRHGRKHATSFTSFGDCTGMHWQRTQEHAQHSNHMGVVLYYCSSR